MAASPNIVSSTEPGQTDLLERSDRAPAGRWLQGRRPQLGELTWWMTSRGSRRCSPAKTARPFSRPTPTEASHHLPRNRRTERGRPRLIAGFGLDEGESIGALLQQGPPTPRSRTSMSTRRASPGRGRFPRYFAPDVDRARRRSRRSSLDRLRIDDVMGTPAWKSPLLVVPGRGARRGDPTDAERQFAQRMGANTIRPAHIAR